MTFRLKSALSLYFLLYSITISGTPADSYDKLDPALRKQVMTRWAEKATTVNNLSDEYYKILIETIDGFDFHQFDFELRPVQDYFGVARLTCPQIEELAVNPDILKISLAGKNRMTLDESLPMISADRIHNGDLGRTYKGSGVIIGIYDSGIDWHHPDFIDPNTGQTRILMIWDQTISTGSPPSNFGNGTLFTQNQIQAELDGSNSGIVQSFDFWGHGTHIAGIAGGNGGLSSTYMGMAPFTEFIIVKGSDYGEVSDDQVIDGVDFTLQQAQILGRPVVINLSLGKQQGPHDGTSLFERIIDGFLWDPGRSIVVAAGNEGDESIHISIDFDNESPDESIAVQFTVPENQINHPDYMLLEGWYAPGSDFEITLEMPSGQMVGPASRGSIVRWPDVVHPVVYIDNANGGVDSQNGDRRIYISLFDVQSNEGDLDFETGIWTLHLSCDAGRLDMWLYNQTVGGEFLNYVDPNTTLNEPANARRVISVGSFISRTEWPSQQGGLWGPGGLELGALSNFSNHGPTRDNSVQSNPGGKPEITAPGEFVLSALSADITNAPGGYYTASDGTHLAWKGTSMSAPHVTGLIALLFEADPTLTSSDAKSILIQSADVDEFTGETWNESWGYGKLDAYDALDLATSVSERENNPQISDFTLNPAFPNPFNGTTCIQYVLNPYSFATPARLELVNTRGQRVRFWKLDAKSGVQTILWDARDQSGQPVPSGVYLAVITAGSLLNSQKILYLK